MLKLIFIIIYWVAFFFLRRFFDNYGLDINDRIYNLAGAAIFVSLVAAYAFLASFFRAYLGVNKIKSANRRTGEPEKITAAATKQPDEAAKTTEAETGRTGEAAKKDKNSVPQKKSRVRVLRGTQDE